MTGRPNAPPKQHQVKSPKAPHIDQETTSGQLLVVRPEIHPGLVHINYTTTDQPSSRASLKFAWGLRKNPDKICTVLDPSLVLTPWSSLNHHTFSNWHVNHVNAISELPYHYQVKAHTPHHETVRQYHSRMIDSLWHLCKAETPLWNYTPPPHVAGQHVHLRHQHE